MSQSSNHVVLKNRAMHAVVLDPAGGLFCFMAAVDTGPFADLPCWLNWHLFAVPSIWPRMRTTHWSVRFISTLIHGQRRLTQATCVYAPLKSACRRRTRNKNMYHVERHWCETFGLGFCRQCQANSCSMSLPKRCSVASANRAAWLARWMHKHASKHRRLIYCYYTNTLHIANYIVKCI